MTAPWTYNILISGRLGSGKTTTQRGLVEAIAGHLGENTIVMAVNFADELKNECALHAGVPQDTFYSEEGKKTYLPLVQMTGRELLQRVGEEARQRNPAHWIERVQERVARVRAEQPNANVLVVVGDCRHPNEVDLMRPGLAVRLEGDPADVRLYTTANLSHASETSMDAYEDFDMRVNTDVSKPNEVVQAILTRLVTVDPVRFNGLALK